MIEADQISLLACDLFHKFNFNLSELVAGRICNFTRVAQQLKKYLLVNLPNKHLPTVVIFARNLTQDQFVLKNQQYHDLNVLNSQMHIKIHLNQAGYYFASLKPGVWLQYWLLFRQLGIEIELFTSEMALQLNYLKLNQNFDFNLITDLDQIAQAANFCSANLYTRFSQGSKGFGE